MSSFIKVKGSSASLLERFGSIYLDFFLKIGPSEESFNLTDQEIKSKTDRITRKGIILCCVISIIFVSPIVWVDLYFSDAPLLVHYGWITVVTVFSLFLELVFLFLVALKLVAEIGKLVNIRAVETDYLMDGLFSVKSILARTALELPDPELEILGIDPFQRISKKNLLVIGLIYKSKIFLTNFILKNLFLLFSIKTLFGISILYAAVLVECFWNGVVIMRVINEARLRLFGFAVAASIRTKLRSADRLSQLSTEAKSGCLRAIGNAVVMTQNYHPNMVVLLLVFQKELNITTPDRYDDWSLFIKTLQTVNDKEKYFLLDLFTVAAAFDGKISSLEKAHLREVYRHSHDLYHARLLRLTGYLKMGRFNRALDECGLDFTEG